MATINDTLTTITINCCGAASPIAVYVGVTQKRAKALFMRDHGHLLTIHEHIEARRSRKGDEDKAARHFALFSKRADDIVWA